ncbi:MAG TPA: hypothetical protein DGG95_17080 [Cytophagales bacterium]|nr:hypothetical protein [Cytophagales bacterium]
MRRLWVLMAIILISCSKNSIEPLHGIYVAGVSYVNDNFGFKPTAAYWKNGEEISLSGGEIHSFAEDIAVSGNDVYVVGTISDVANSEKPLFWKNGVMNSLNVLATFGSKSVMTSKANSIAISGSDIYACGFISDGGSYFQAVYWKNGNMIALPNGNSKQASAISISNNDVYIAASTGYWKNEVYKSLPNTDLTSTVMIFGILASGSDFYVAGTTYNEQSATATLWKNDSIITHLPNNNFINSAARAIAISGTDVYIVGSLTNDFSSYTGVYWKNGNLIELTGEGSNSPNSVIVNGSEIYVAGTVNASTSYGVYWRNNVPVTLPNCGVANAIVVK